MKVKKNKTYTLAFSSVIAALSLVFMFITTFIPVGTYALPCFAGALLAAVVLEAGYISASLVYVAVSVLSLLFVSDKEAVLYYIAFLGFYPIIKGLLERIKKRVLQYILKILIFNICIVAAFYIGLFLLSVPKESFVLFGVYLPWVFLVLGNLVFVVYDFCLTRLITQYVEIWRKRIKFK